MGEVFQVKNQESVLEKTNYEVLSILKEQQNTLQNIESILQRIEKGILGKIK